MRHRFNTKKLLCMIGGDLLLLAVLMLMFAYFHHVRVQEIVPQELKRHTAAPTEPPVATPAPQEGEATPEVGSVPVEPTLEPTAEPTGLLKGKFADKFVSGEPVSDENTYRSENIAIEVRTETLFDNVVHIADIYINDISCLRTAVFDQYGKRYMSTKAMSEAAGALLAISGDHFYAHLQTGVLAIRNGKLYADNDNGKQDAYVLYYDGTMEGYRAGEIDLDAIYAREPYQLWYFGPLLLNPDGTAIAEFTETVRGDNPRSSIGYYEPGHYCFVMVEGRTNKSDGATLEELAKIFEELGCVSAYNLDGGKTAVITFGGKVRSTILGSGRLVSDIVYIAEPEAAATAQPAVE